MGDAFRSDRGDPLNGVEHWQLDQPTTTENRGQDGCHPGNMVRRHGHQGGLVSVGSQKINRAEDVSNEMTLPQHHRFGSTAGTRRVQHDGDVVVVERPLLWLRKRLGKGIDRRRGGRGRMCR